MLLVSPGFLGYDTGQGHRRRPAQGEDGRSEERCMARGAWPVEVRLAGSIVVSRIDGRQLIGSE
jgi:hypothetical protein